MGDVVFEDEERKRQFGAPKGVQADKKDSYITSLFMKFGLKSKLTTNIAMIIFVIVMFLISFYFFGFFG